MREIVFHECVDCGSPKVENQDTGRCSSCGILQRRANKVKPSDNNSPINSRSPKGKQVTSRYLSRLRTWKRGKKCAATFPHECSTEIECHHMAGRSDSGFYDEWAEENGIVLTLDERFWKPLCPEAHRYVTKNSRWACENGYSFLRVSDPVFRKEINT